MAFNTTTDRGLKISIDLGGLIEGRIAAVVATQKRERALMEAKFQQTVVDQGLSYDAQIEYRKKQIEEEKTKVSPDLDYLTTLEGSVKDLRKLNRFKKIRADYLSNYENLKSGSISLKDHERFLTEQLADAPDEDARTEIRTEISKVRTQISEADINTLKNRVLLAQKDGTVDVLNKTIDDVAKRKAFADLAGNTEESSAWDVSLTSLRKQLNETRVNSAAHDIDLNVSRRGGTSIEKLDMLNSEISKADTNNPIVINGVNYNSARAYWESKRDSYIAGVGDDSNFKNFFTDLEAEVKSKVDTVSKINKFGFVPVPTLEAIQRDYDVLASRPEFVNQTVKLGASKVSALSYGVDKSAKALTSSAVEELQVKQGLDALATLESKFGIDLSTEKASLNMQIIQKGSQLPGIKAATEELGKVGAETPPTTPEIKPKELLKTNIQPKVVPETTPPAPIQPAQPVNQPPEQKPQPQFKEVTIQRGDTLSGIALRELGDAKRYKELAELNQLPDPNKIIAGAKLKIPTA